MATPAEPPTNMPPIRRIKLIPTWRRSSPPNNMFAPVPRIVAGSENAYSEMTPLIASTCHTIATPSGNETAKSNRRTGHETLFNIEQLSTCIDRTAEVALLREENRGRLYLGLHSGRHRCSEIVTRPSGVNYGARLTHGLGD